METCGDCSDKVGNVKLKLKQPLKEPLLWSRLPSHECLSAGSMVVVEPSESRTSPSSLATVWT